MSTLIKEASINAVERSIASQNLDKPEITMADL